MDLEDIAAIGQEPTPSAIASFLVAHLEVHGATSRSDLVLAVEREWASVGGKEIPRGKTTLRVKKALAMLGGQGITQNPMLGIYRLAVRDEGPVDVSTSNVELQTNGYADSSSTDFSEEVLAQDTEAESEADACVGTGDQYVYAFYLPTYRRIAEVEGHLRWPIRVGMTTTSVGQRMAAHRTSLPEQPRLGLIARTDNAALLERVIQGILTMRGLRAEDAGGPDWFETNPDELAAIYAQVVGTGDGAPT
ncbi:hypothetical protein [Arthrobacter sp. efr-133-TYG-118]|uniref:hypothetical protein n=1 Tax=Arthrobacter sp. efr-133-TYG-118 TaxID=3040279 RepID=UPI00254D5531|nr:hypothetical protein [Arthrobacter sp. efr-133-TYG-118]